MQSITLRPKSLMGETQKLN